jgi:ABC-type multidrug transport system ATPase subunit
VALEAHAAKPVRQLSRGLLQRAALARALLHAPALLLLDEPYTGLDAPSARRLTETLAALRADGTTFVVVSHAPAEAWDAVDRAAVLHRGGWAWQGPRPDHPDLLEARYREARDG